MRVKLGFKRGVLTVQTTRQGYIDVTWTPALLGVPVSSWSMTPEDARRTADALNAAASEMEDASARRT